MVNSIDGRGDEEYDDRGDDKGNGNVDVDDLNGEDGGTVVVASG